MSICHKWYKCIPKDTREAKMNVLTEINGKQNNNKKLRKTQKTNVGLE